MAFLIELDVDPKRLIQGIDAELYGPRKTVPRIVESLDRDAVHSTRSQRIVRGKLDLACANRDGPFDRGIDPDVGRSKRSRRVKDKGAHRRYIAWWSGDLKRSLGQRERSDQDRDQQDDQDRGRLWRAPCPKQRIHPFCDHVVMGDLEKIMQDYISSEGCAPGFEGVKCRRAPKSHEPSARRRRRAPAVPRGCNNAIPQATSLRSPGRPWGSKDGATR